jgi:uncharacterized protein (TIGR00369 family)
VTPTPDTEPPPPDDGHEPAGLARVRMMQTGQRPMPGMWRTLGMRLVEVAEGRAVVEVVAGQRHANGNDISHGGLVAAMADSATGAAVSTTLASGERISTVDLQVDYHRPVPLTHHSVVASADVVQRGRRLAHADARVTVGGRLVATGRAVFAVFDRR